MPPRSKVLVAAVESVASPTLRRSSRRSIPTSVPRPQHAAASTLITSPTPVASPSPASPLKRQRNKSESSIEATALIAQCPPSPARTRRSIKTEKVSSLIEEEALDCTITDEKPTATKKRRTKKEAVEEEIFPSRPSPFLPSTKAHAVTGDRRDSGLFIGAHISSAGGVENAPLNALRIGGNAFSCFVRPKMQWASNPIPDTSAVQFKQRIKDFGFMPDLGTENEANVRGEPHGTTRVGREIGYVIPHGCYLVNLANPAIDKREKSFEAFIDDLQRCEQLGVRLFNFHPGSMTAASATDEHPSPPTIGPLTSVRAAKEESCKLVAEYINRAHNQTSSVVILIENMAGSKNDTILGSSLHDLSTIISHVNNKSRVGVCIDTCHAFAAGYDITTKSTYADFIKTIQDTIGWESVKGFHLNDSKFGLGCKLDRHANIGRGEIGLGGFWCVVNDERWHGIPLILETPALGNAIGGYTAKEAQVKMHQVWYCQIQALYSLRGTKWGQWEAAEEWLARADEVIQEAERLHAAKKRSEAKDVAKKKTKKAKQENDGQDQGSSDLGKNE
ncbi:related to APN1 - AP endonuclease [Melanopsichium pennsylvanicum]|uniref:Related to APN1 - AP endonuclease n=2 Tax=Melanopsichium pennsylvanicum TaxID=63383 RepID=A0AAJ4XFY1_9BASI|nr:related to APN1-AP endonuclease [Melanopsichium pennsylvanicum 4]SNX81622.1 related to APN1 - AP endonuclease [Melanopsichium pennsylvanicum]